LRKIIFDVDNVLADSISCWCAKASRYLGYTVCKEQIKSHKIIGSVAMPTGEIFRFQDEVWKEWKQLPPTEKDISEIFMQLRERDFRIIVATSRPLRLTKSIRHWLDYNNLNYDELRALGPLKYKADIYADFLVDDAPEQIFKFIKKGHIGFIYQQPWNIKKQIPKAIRLSSLSKLVGLIEKCTF
jgi:5'(3')-deoxyribonucleotidase